MLKRFAGYDGKPEQLSSSKLFSFSPGCNAQGIPPIDILTRKHACINNFYEIWLALCEERWIQLEDLRAESSEWELMGLTSHLDFSVLFLAFFPVVRHVCLSMASRVLKWIYILCCVFGRGKSGNHSLGFGLCTRRGDRDFLSGLLLQRFDCSANSSHSAWVAGDPCEENLPGDERTGARVM